MGASGAMDQSPCGSSQSAAPSANFAASTGAGGDARFVLTCATIVRADSQESDAGAPVGSTRPPPDGAPHSAPSVSSSPTSSARRDQSAMPFIACWGASAGFRAASTTSVTHVAMYEALLARRRLFTGPHGIPRLGRGGEKRVVLVSKRAV